MKFAESFDVKCAGKNCQNKVSVTDINVPCALCNECKTKLSLYRKKIDKKARR